MDESKPGTNTLRQKNMRVFAIGASIALLGTLLTAFRVILPVWVEEPIVGWAMLFAIITILARVIPVGLIQLIIIFPIFYVFSKRDKEISGVMTWLFYAFELLIGFVASPISELFWDLVVGFL